MGASQRPSLWRPSRFAAVYHFATFGGWLLLAIAVFRLVPAIADRGAPAAFWMIAALVVVGEIRPVVTAGNYDSQGVPTSHAFVFAILYLWGPWPAVVILALATAMSERFKRKPMWKLFFNVGQYVLSLGTAALVMSVFAPVPEIGPLDPASPALSPSSIVWVVLGWLAFFVVNDLLVAGTCDDVGRTFSEEFYFDIGYYIFTTFSVLALSPFIAFTAYEWVYLPLILLPLYAVWKTARISREQEHQSLHDALTGLPNRKLLLQRLEADVEARDREGESLALCLLDLDQFKEVNDTLGHHVGDQLLTVVAARIQSVLRPADTVARLGGDEFAVLLSPVRDADAAVEVAQRIQLSLTEPFHVEGIMLELEASIGVAVYPEHSADSDQLMRRADVAMYLAKEERTGVEVYVADRDHNSASRLALLASLRTAVENGELELHYQPKVGMGSGRVVGVEALLRWRHPTRGLVMPDEFIQLAERSGLMPSITEYVVDVALAQVAQWRRVGLDVPVAVNVAMRDVQGPGLLGTVVAGLERHDLPASSIQLELTERVLSRGGDAMTETLESLRRIGVEISLDDFGTEHSTMVLLKRMPVSEIKIDRSFVSRLTTDPEDVTIVRSIVGLAHGLGMRAVAEGVETEQVWDLLAELGCDAVQGWYVSRPMAAAPATEWLLRHPSRRGALQVLQEARGSAGTG